MAPKPEAAVVKTQEESPSRLDQIQVHKASGALLKHIGDKKQSSSSKNLLEAGNEDSASASVPIWLVVNTKKNIIDKSRLKPGRITLPHTLNRPDSAICLITADPQRAYKDVIAEEAFPTELRKQIRVLGLEKLKKRYKSFEQRRQLFAEYDVFLADERVIVNLPHTLGKIAYQSSKRPMPVNLAIVNEKKEPKVPGKRVVKDVSQRKTPSAATLANRIQGALTSARVHLAPSATTTVHVGYSHFTPEQLDENINAVVNGMVAKFIPKGWKNVKTLYIKGPNTAALPIWQTTELWTEESEVLEDEEAKKRIEASKRKRGAEDGKSKKKPKLLGDESGFSPEMAARRAALREAQKTIEAAPIEVPVDVKKMKVETKTTSNGKVKEKIVKSRTVSASA